MPEGTRQAGSWLGDLTNEWKTAKTPEKVVIVGAIAATVGIALYLHKQSTGAPNQPGAAGNQYGIPANFQSGAPGGVGSVGATPGGPVSPPGTPLPPVPAPPTQPAPKPPTLTGRPIIAGPVKQPTTVTQTYAKPRPAPAPPHFANVPTHPGGPHAGPTPGAVTASTYGASGNFGPAPKPRSVKPIRGPY